jgi:uncharacterized membrane-anchored protein YhcB (DUF1043 family)
MNMNYKNTNIFKVLDEYDEYEGFEDVVPYNIVIKGSYKKVIDGKWEMLGSSPTAKLIKERFSHWYDGKLTIYEINAIKEEMDKAKYELDKFRDEIYENKYELVCSLREQRRLCKSNDECVQKLDAHLKICGGIDGNGKYKCGKDYVSYDCQFKENGRCSHYYEIERIEERLGNYQYADDSYYEAYIDLQIAYERALAIKENRLKEYQQQLEDDFDDWSHELSMRMC